MSTKADRAGRIGFVVDAGPEIGYGHVVRSMRIADRVRDDLRAEVSFFPLSNACGRFLASRGETVRCDTDFPALMVSDLPELHPFLDAVQSHGCRHVGIRDLGLAQGDANVLIDGSIATVTPYTERPQRRLFTGPRYMVTSTRSVSRNPGSRAAFVTLGGGTSSEYTPRIVSGLVAAGFEVYATPGFSGGFDGALPTPIPGAIWVTDEAGIGAAMSRATVGIATAGVSLYEMLAGSVPTVALGVNDLQMRTATAFRDEGAIESLGRMDDVSIPDIVDCVQSLDGDDRRKRRLVERGRRLVDGRGLFRVAEILRKELCRKEFN